MFNWTVKLVAEGMEAGAAAHDNLISPGCVPNQPNQPTRISSDRLYIGSNPSDLALPSSRPSMQMPCRTLTSRILAAMSLSLQQQGITLGASVLAA